jgi:hypothetical protein
MDLIHELLAFIILLRGHHLSLWCRSHLSPSRTRDRRVLLRSRIVRGVHGALELDSIARHRLWWILKSIGARAARERAPKDAIIAIGSRWGRMNEHAARIVLVRVGSLVVVAESLVQLLNPLLDLVLPDALVVDRRLGGALVQLVLVEAVLLMFAGVLELLFDRIGNLLIFVFSRNHFFVGLTAPSFFFLVSFPRRLPSLVHDALRGGWPLLWRSFIATSGFAFTERSTWYRTFHLLPATSL